MVDCKYAQWSPNNLNVLHPETIIEKYVQIGAFNVVEANCVLRRNVSLENHITLKEKTVVGKRTRIENGVQTSGFCSIGEDCVVKQQSVIGRQVVIKDRVFIAPFVVFLYTDHKQKWHGKETVVEEGVFIGSGCSIASGVRIAKNVTVGAMSLVNSDLDQEGGIYFGVPAKLVRIK